MNFIVNTIILAAVTAVALSLPGVFLVLRKQSMMSEAISHAVLPGIVIALFFTRNLDSPLLIVGAALMGLVVVVSSEVLKNTGLLEGDASQGLIFPGLFSIGIILISMEFNNVHLDEHIVLVGDLNMASFIPLTINGVNIGPRYLYVMLGVLLLNIIFIKVFYKELKICTFDPALAKCLGFRPKLMHYLLMLMVSITITAAFYSAGSILTIALMIVPAACAHLITHDLKKMILVSVIIALISSVGGFYSAYVLNASTSGTMAFFCGLIFLLTFFFAPKFGVISKWNRRKKQQISYSSI